MVRIHPEFPYIDEVVDLARIAKAQFRTAFQLCCDSSDRDQFAYRNELTVKLENLEYCLERLQSIIAELRTISDDLEHERPNSAFRELKFYSESFYYFAFRTITLFKDAPVFDALNCPGVTLVRNHLMEHSKTPAMTGSFMHGFLGPQLRTLDDRGLYANAVEFYSTMLAMFERVIERSRR